MRTISGSVGLNGRNLQADVRNVQELLNKARASQTLPPIKVDGFNGPETVGAIRGFQKGMFGWNDGRVDPGGPTLEALNAFDSPPSERVRCNANELSGGTTAPSGPRLSFVSFKANESPTTTTTTAPKAATPKETALLHKMEALTWIGAALNAFTVVRPLLETGLTADFQKMLTTVEFQALKTHFHFDKHTNQIKFLTELGKTYTLMKISVNTAETTFANDFLSDDFANSDPGGFDRRMDKSNPGRMYFCMKYMQVGPLTRVVTILHECAHYVDKNIDHFASAVPSPDGRALTGTNGTARTHNYAQMTPLEAQQNAASYAGFAIHMAKRVDTRPTITQ